MTRSSDTDHADNAPLCDVSIVIPVYNSAATLAPLVERLSTVLSALGLTFELVMVDDGSEDGSWARLTALQTQHPSHVVAIQLMRNFGQHNAIMCGLRHAGGRFVVTMDDDLQNAPEDVPALLAALRDGGLDLVYGYAARKQHRRWRNAGTFVVRFVHRVVFGTAVPTTSFRAMRRELVRSILSYDLNYTYLDGLLAWNTQRVGMTPVEHHERPSGRSGYSLAKLLGLGFNLLTNFSLLPLQLVSAVGFTVAIVGLLLGAFYLVQYLGANIAVPGYASTIVAILTLGGLQLLALGMMGEYLGRVHLNINRKPQYTQREVPDGRATAAPSPTSNP